MDTQTNHSFSIMIKSFNVTFEEQDDASFRIKTQYDDFSYEGSSFMKPIGKKGAEVLEKFLHYTDIEFETKHIKSDQSNSIVITIKHMILDEDIVILLRREEVSDLTILKRDITRLRKEQTELEKVMTDDFKKQLIQQNKTITAIEKRISIMEDNIDFQIMMAKKIYVCYDGTDLHISDRALEKYLTDTIINKKFLLELTTASGAQSQYAMTEQEWWSIIREKSLKNLNKVFRDHVYHNAMHIIKLILDSKKYIITDIISGSNIVSCVSEHYIPNMYIDRTSKGPRNTNINNSFELIARPLMNFEYQILFNKEEYIATVGRYKKEAIVNKKLVYKSHTFGSNTLRAFICYYQ